MSSEGELGERLDGLGTPCRRFTGRPSRGAEEQRASGMLGAVPVQ